MCACVPPPPHCDPPSQLDLTPENFKNFQRATPTSALWSLEETRALVAAVTRALEKGATAGNVDWARLAERVARACHTGTRSPEVRPQPRYPPPSMRALPPLTRVAPPSFRLLCARVQDCDAHFAALRAHVELGSKPRRKLSFSASKHSDRARDGPTASPAPPAAQAARGTPSPEQTALASSPVVRVGGERTAAAKPAAAKPTAAAMVPVDVIDDDDDDDDDGSDGDVEVDEDEDMGRGGEHDSGSEFSAGGTCMCWSQASSPCTDAVPPCWIARVLQVSQRKPTRLPSPPRALRRSCQSA